MLFGTLAAGLLALASAPDAGPARVALHYDPALVAADFPNPAARLTIGGKTAWFLFDTGAGVHMIAAWFVESAGLELDAGLADAAEGVDSTGQPSALRGLRPLAGRLEDGSRLELGSAFVGEFPPDFEQAQVAGALSPQLLARAGQAVALDLRVPELRLEPFEQAARRLGARALPPAQVQYCGSPRDAVPNLAFALGVSAGGAQGRLTVDSGAAHTKIAAHSPLARGASRSGGGTTVGLAGRPQAYELARGLRLSFAGFERAVDARISESPGGRCGPDGLLGLDALGRCALVLADQAFAIRCTD